MKESYVEGLAAHDGPESCAGGGDSAGEALTGVRAGWVSSREIHAPPVGGSLRGADAVEEGGRPHRTRRQREARPDPARSKAPGTHGNISHGNREIPRPSAAEGVADRNGKSKD
jgi:RNA-directed DNA polymerase